VVDERVFGGEHELNGGSESSYGPEFFLLSSSSSYLKSPLALAMAQDSVGGTARSIPRSSYANGIVRPTYPFYDGSTLSTFIDGSSSWIGRGLLCVWLPICHAFPPPITPEKGIPRDDPIAPTGPHPDFTINSATRFTGGSPGNVCPAFR